MVVDSFTKKQLMSICEFLVMFATIDVKFQSHNLLGQGWRRISPLLNNRYGREEI